MDESDTSARLRALEEENRRLRRAAGLKPLEPTTFVSTFKDKPIITFEMPSGRPFSFGVTKARAILEKIEDIKRFVEANPHPLPSDDGQGPPHGL